MGMDPHMTHDQAAMIYRLLDTYLIRASVAGEIIEKLLGEVNPADFDPREQWKHHVRDYPQPRKAVDFPDIP